jgi:hypothetical protein
MNKLSELINNVWSLLYLGSQKLSIAFFSRTVLLIWKLLWLWWCVHCPFFSQSIGLLTVTALLVTKVRHFKGLKMHKPGQYPQLSLPILNFPFTIPNSLSFSNSFLFCISYFIYIYYVQHFKCEFFLLHYYLLITWRYLFISVGKHMQTGHKERI